MSESMAERVGRAIANADMEDYMEFFQRYDAMARAAIEAMREPTEEMKDAAFAKTLTIPKKAYIAMIDAALREG